jgi:hypothetical protein
VKRGSDPFKYTVVPEPSEGVDFDVGDIAALVDPALVKTEVVPVPGVDWDMWYDHRHTHERMLRIYDIDRDATFALLFRKIARSYPSE